AVLTELGIRRLGRQVVESIVAAALGLLLGVLVVLALRTWGSDELVRGLSVFTQGEWRLTVPGAVAGVGRLRTAAGPRHLARPVVESIVAAALGLLLGVLVVLALRTWGSDELVRGLSVFTQGEWRLTVPGYVAAIGGLLTAAGTRTRRRTVKWSWNLLFVAIG